MSKLRCIPLIFVLSGCSTGADRLLVAHITSPQPRSVLEESVQKHGVPKFLYLDRKSDDLYVLGETFPEFQFKRVDFELLKSTRPEIAGIVACITSKQCSSSDTYYAKCQSTIPLRVKISDQQQTDIASLMRARGYPVAEMTFIGPIDSPGAVKITYFSECAFVRSDFIQNFPQIIAR